MKKRGMTAAAVVPSTLSAGSMWRWLLPFAVLGLLHGVTIDDALAIDPPHTNDCSACHILHNAPGAAITNVAGNANLCITCHTGGGLAAAYPFADVDQAVPGVSGTSHRWDSGPSGYTEADLANTSPGSVLSGGAYTGRVPTTYTITISAAGDAGVARFDWVDNTSGGDSTDTVRDEFEGAASYGNNNGTVSWAGNWIENDPQGGGASGGKARVTGGELRMDQQGFSGFGVSAAREVDLSGGVTSATFSFDFRTTSGVDATDAVAIEISDNGGSSYFVRETITGISGASSGSRSYDIWGYRAVNTRVRFRITNSYAGTNEYFYADNVQVEFTTPSAGSGASNVVTGADVPLADGLTVSFLDGGTSPSFELGDIWTLYVLTDLQLPTALAMSMRIKDGKIMCSTCHDQHSQANQPFDPAAPAYAGRGTGEGRHFQRLNNDVNQMCVDCHAPRDVQDSNLGSHPVGVPIPAGEFQVPTALPLDSANEVQCMSCHQLHRTDSGGVNGGAGDGYLLRQGMTEICTDCHVHADAGTGTSIETVRDEFNSVSYGNNNGGVNWAGNWIEDDPQGGGASGGKARVTGGDLRLDQQGFSGYGVSAAREADLSGGVVSATFSFDFNTSGGVDSSDEVTIEVSNDGGGGYDPLGTITGITGSSSGSRSYDVFGWVAVNTRIRFRITNLYAGSNEYFYADNVQIQYETPGASGGGSHYDAASGALWPGGQYGSSFPAHSADKQGACVNCHWPHGWPDDTNMAQDYPLLWVERYDIAGDGSDPDDAEDLCYTCHDGNPAGTDVKTVFAKAIRHPVADSEQAAGRSVECTDCHNPHQVNGPAHTYNTTANASRNNVSGALAGVLGWSVDYTGLGNFVAPAAGNYADIDPAVKEYQICYKCHSAKSWSFGTAPNGLSANGSVANPVLTDVAQEFSPQNRSGHPVTTGLNNYVNSASPRALSTSDMKAPWNSNVGTQTMMCSDCHNTDASSPAAQGPHGSAAQFMLRGPNTAWPNLTSFNSSFCANCHNDAPVHAEKDDHRTQCYRCHIVIPHGGKMGRLIADRDGAMPSRYAYSNSTNNVWIYSFRKQSRNNYDKDDCRTSCGSHDTGSSGSMDNW